MSGRVLSFAGSDHAESQRLLPWFVQGMLEAHELARVQRHLEECARCRRDADELRAWSAAWASDSDEAGSRAHADAEHGLARLRRRLQLDARGRHARVEPARAASAWQRAPRGLRWVLAAQAAVIAVIAAWLTLHPSMLSGNRDTVAPAYRTLSDAPSAPSAQSIANVHRLIVVFDEQASTARVQALLQANQARIVDGPSETGAYVIAVAAPRAAAVRSALRAAPEVRLAESLDPAQ